MLLDGLISGAEIHCWGHRCKWHSATNEAFYFLMKNYSHGVRVFPYVHPLRSSQRCYCKKKIPCCAILLVYQKKNFCIFIILCGFLQTFISYGNSHFLQWVKDLVFSAPLVSASLNLFSKYSWKPCLYKCAQHFILLSLPPRAAVFFLSNPDHSGLQNPA